MYDSEEILGMPLLPTQYCVDGLIPRGLSILGGAPKVGKSWLVFDLCMSVAGGKTFLTLPTVQGTTLCLCLEDSLNRIRQRLCLQEAEECSNAYFATASGTLADGLCEQIRAFAETHRDTRLVVIDTLQLVRRPSQELSYGGDYAELRQLKELADELELSLMAVHHLRKQGDADPLNKLSGTTGISGVADAVFILDRENRLSRRATLTCMGRDIEDRILELEFSPQSCKWELLSDSTDPSLPPLPEEMNSFYEFMRELKYFCGGNAELAEKFKSATGIDMTPKALKQMMRKNLVGLDKHGITYCSNRSNGRRIVTVRYTAMLDESLNSDASAVNDAKNTPSKICGPCVTCAPVGEREAV